MDWDALWSWRTLMLVNGLLHFCQVPAMLVAVRMLDWGEDFAKLKPINRRSVKVIGLAIVLTVLGLGVVVICAPSEVAGGSRLGTALAGFLTVFWAYRGTVQIAVYRRIMPEGRLGRLSHWGLSALFIFQAAAYAAGFVRGLSL